MIYKKYFKKHQLSFKDNQKFFQRLKYKSFFNKKILDVGCGLGSLEIDIAKTGGKVVGIDVNREYIKFDKKVIKKYPQYQKYIQFKALSFLEFDGKEKFDIIIFKNSLEHLHNLERVFNKVYKLLKVNGKVLIGFGPLYYSPYGGHVVGQKIPWAHLFIQKKLPSFLKLNKLKPDQYLKIMKKSRLKIDYLNYNVSTTIFAKIVYVLSKIPFIKNFFIFNMYCILSKKKL